MFLLRKNVQIFCIFYLSRRGKIKQKPDIQPGHRNANRNRNLQFE